MKFFQKKTLSVPLWGGLAELFHLIYRPKEERVIYVSILDFAVLGSNQMRSLLKRWGYPECWLIYWKKQLSRSSLMLHALFWTLTVSSWLNLRDFWIFPRTSETFVSAQEHSSLLLKESHLAEELPQKPHYVHFFLSNMESSWKSQLHVKKVEKYKKIKILIPHFIKIMQAVKI